MPAKPKTTTKPAPAQAAGATVTAFMAALSHPHKPAIERLRALLLSLDPRIVEEVKWNAPSFRLHDHFATFRVQPPKSIQLVLHTGARAQRDAKAFEIDDPDRLLAWPATDRAVLTLASEAELLAHEEAVRTILAQWIARFDDGQPA